MADDLQTTLSTLELFSDLDVASRERIAALGRIEHWRDGALILEEGAPHPRMMVILEGRASILRRDGAGVQQSIASLGPGEVLGEVGLLIDLPKTAAVQAEGSLVGFVVDRAAFAAQVALDDPAALRLGIALSRVLARRLVRFNERVGELLSEDASLRRRLGEARQEVFELWDPLDQGTG